jgi:hypothetical protein
VSVFCSIAADVSSLKPLERRFGKNGYYYVVDYELAVYFGSELVFGLIRDGKVVDCVTAKYV